MVERVCGLDEAGRGALAGPLVVAAVVMPKQFRFEDAIPPVRARDSKQLTSRQRLACYDAVLKLSNAIKIEVMSVTDINNCGINWANIEAFRRLISKIAADEYIIDGRWNLPNLGAKARRTGCVVRADTYIPAVMAAGIVAKVRRDRIMYDLASVYPVYGWASNTGHGTASHIGALRSYGSCEQHRLQFVSTALGKSSEVTSKPANEDHFKTGQRA